MSTFDDLLIVQDHDSALDRLRHRRETLPERDALAGREEEIEVIRAELEQLRARRDEAVREEKRLDDTVSAVEERRAEIERSLYSGSTSSPRELQAMQAEIEQFKRQRRSYEDQELDVMERRELLDTDVKALEVRLDATAAHADELRRALAAAEAEIDAEVQQEQATRSALADRLPPDIVSLYQQVRAKQRGVGAARLLGGTCQGCHLSLPAVEVDRIKHLPPDALVRCEQCGCILVRS